MNRDLLVIYAAAFLRALGVGITGVVLGLYLARAGFSATAIGIVVAAGLAGAALATLLTSFRADRLGRRRTLVALSLLAALGGFLLPLAGSFPALLGLAFLGMVNGMGRDRGPASALEQAIIPEAIPAERRTWALAWYNIVLDAGHALGALAGALPLLLRTRFEVDLLPSYQITFGVYGGLGIVGALLYAFLSPQIEVRGARPPSAGPDELRGAARPALLDGVSPAISPEGKRVVTRLSALFFVDAFAGGFLTNALLAYWFFNRFGVAEGSLAPLFAVTRVANALSHLVAARLARRFGLVNTMVFTHIPSSLLLMTVPFAPSFAWAVALFLARESLVEMDVPTRQSYVVALVAPAERTFASGMTSVVRNAGWAAAPTFAGLFMQQVSLAAPLIIAGGMKIVYDVLLYFSFRRVKPPEERKD
ncbi:MAG: MFS transporter [Terriglobales bacterium]